MPKEGTGKIKIVDGRKVSYSTGEPLKVAKTGEYDSEVIKQIVTAAKRVGVDPYTALAVGMQESGLGSYKTENAQANWGQVNLKKWSGNPELIAELEKNNDLNPHAVAMNFILKKSLSENEGSEDVKIQGYNGYLLKPNNDIGATTMYGIDLTKYPKGYDLKADPRYGRSVIDLRDNVLKKNKTVTEYVNNIIQPQKEFAGITVSASKGATGKMALNFMKDGKTIKSTQVEETAFNNPVTRASLLRTALSEK